jgi:hypothetical protein
MPASSSQEFGSHGRPARTAFSSASSSLRMSQIIGDLPGVCWSAPDDYDRER